MMELLDIRFTFSCRTSHCNSEGKSPIVLRTIYRGERRDIFTGIYVFTKHWNSKNQRISRGNADYKPLNQNLQLIHRKAADVFDKLKFSGNDFTIDELVDKIRGKEERPTLLIEFLEQGCEKMKKRVGTEMLHVTYAKYARSVIYMKEFRPPGVFTAMPCGRGDPGTPIG